MKKRDTPRKFLIFKETPIRIPRKTLQRIYAHLFQSHGSLNLICTTKKKSRTLHKIYRGKDTPTNILTFPAISESAPAEIYIDIETAKKESEERSITLASHVSFLFIHGILHLRGHAHGEKMEYLEDMYFKKYV